MSEKTMKALSLHADFAFAIAAGVKTIEYRTWQPKELGDILICTSTRNLGGAFIYGYAIAIVEVYKVDKVAPRNFEWHLRNVRLVDPFPVKGKLHLYDVPLDEVSLMDFEAINQKRKEVGLYLLEEQHEKMDCMWYAYADADLLKDKDEILQDFAFLYQLSPEEYTQEWRDASREWYENMLKFINGEE